MRVIARIPSMGLVWLGVAAAWGQTASRPAGEISVAAYRSIQEAIDANPGRMLFVPPGDHTAADKVRLRSDRSGLYGPGRIVQTNPGVPIVENAAQGIDIHADHVIVAQNIVNDAFMGMKAMHGSRHVLIVGNQFSKSALWAIGLMPGAASHAGGAGEGGKPVEPNVDGGSIIAQNIISDFGYGKSYWIWGGSGHECFPILLDRGQKPTNPPLADVLIQGNVVYDTGRDGVLADGTVKAQPPRYQYAVRVTDGPFGPKGLHFSGNLFHPGTAGVANVELKP